MQKLGQETGKKSAVTGNLGKAGFFLWSAGRYNMIKVDSYEVNMAETEIILHT